MKWHKFSVKRPKDGDLILCCISRFIGGKDKPISYRVGVRIYSEDKKDGPSLIIVPKVFTGDVCSVPYETNEFFKEAFSLNLSNLFWCPIPSIQKPIKEHHKDILRYNKHKFKTLEGKFLKKTNLL
jgi:hypothetical protein